MYPVYRKGKHANKKNNIPLKNSPPSRFGWDKKKKKKRYQKLIKNNILNSFQDLIVILLKFLEKYPMSLLIFIYLIHCNCFWLCLQLNSYTIQYQYWLYSSGIFLLNVLLASIKKKSKHYFISKSTTDHPLWQLVFNKSLRKETWNETQLQW